MSFTLPELTFDTAAFAPFCSPETFQFHHGKHHATYVNKLNDAVKDSPLATLPLEEVILRSHAENNRAVFNNAAQHYNHSFFWNCLAPKAVAPGTKTSELLNRDFGGFDQFRETFAQSATTLFGSGWTWLSLNSNGKLEILQLKDADNPLILDKKPLLTLDVWEHAYYIDFRNRRPDYINAFWDFVNWDFVEKQLI
jgi:Fe-Mn family superoxide dismutase